MMKLKFFLSLLIPTIAVGASLYIMQQWIADIQAVFGWFTWVILIGMILIPCFYSFFVVITLLLKQDCKYNLFIYRPISILIAVFNEEDSIIKTIEGVLAQDYPDKIQIIISNDGSTDDTMRVVNEFMLTYTGRIPIIIIDGIFNKGKSAALNTALKYSSYDSIISLDSDTILHDNALRNLVAKYLSDDYAAVAGSIRVNNSKYNFMTRIQKYDYLYGIASVKKSQSLFNTTLVAQGAFSIYRKSILEKYGWTDTMGEDIVLSWDMLEDGYKIGFAPEAVGFTNVPTTYKNFFKQRKRWSIGLIEAFRRNKKVLIRPSYGLPFFWNNLLFMYIDLCYVLFFVPSVIAAIFFKFYLLAGALTLLLLPLGMLLSLVIIITQYRLNKRLGIKNELDWIGFISFIFVYQTIQTPACLAGYISEIFKLKKNWGTRI